jgi:hypothetical protein
MTPENRVACTLVRILVSVTTPRTTTELICDRPDKRCDGILDCADGRDEVGCLTGFCTTFSIFLFSQIHAQPSSLDTN